MKKYMLLVLVAGITPTATGGHIAYLDRSSFEAALSSYSVDNLDGITQGLTTFETRPDYTLSANSMYGVINHAGVGPSNAPLGFDNAYIWSYSYSPITMTFDSAVSGVGFDYAEPLGGVGAGSIRYSINGVQNQSPTQPGFFGVVFDAPTTTFTITQDIAYGIFDNVTYGLADTTAVPEPSSVVFWSVLGGIGLIVGRGRSKVTRAARG